MKKRMFLGMMAMVASPLWATTVVDTFESTMDPWTGDGVLAAETPTKPAYGYPFTGDHVQTLAVSGEVSRVTANVNVFDMMVKFNIPEETPSSPSSDALFAFAADKDGKLLAYCKTTSEGGAGYVPLGDAVYAGDSWMRLTVCVDSTAKSFIVATNGVLTGSTYYLAIDPSSSIVTNVAVCGSTAIDDFVAKSETVTESTYDPYAAVSDTSGTAAAVTADGITVPLNYLTSYNLAATSDAAAAQISNSSPTMTVAQAYVAGIAPTEGATFAITDFEMTSDSLTITFPGSWPADSYTIKCGSEIASLDGTPSSTAAAKDGLVNKVTIPIDFSSANVFYYKVTR